MMHNPSSDAPLPGLAPAPRAAERTTATRQPETVLIACPNHRPGWLTGRCRLCGPATGAYYGLLLVPMAAGEFDRLIGPAMAALESALARLFKLGEVDVLSRCRAILKARGYRPVPLSETGTEQWLAEDTVRLREAWHYLQLGRPIDTRELCAIARRFQARFQEQLARSEDQRSNILRAFGDAMYRQGLHQSGGRQADTSLHAAAVKDRIGAELALEKLDRREQEIRRGDRHDGA
jgi:hypothetical protein